MVTFYTNPSMKGQIQHESVNYWQKTWTFWNIEAWDILLHENKHSGSIPLMWNFWMTCFQWTCLDDWDMRTFCFKWRLHPLFPNKATRRKKANTEPIKQSQAGGTSWAGRGYEGLHLCLCCGSMTIDKTTLTQTRRLVTTTAWLSILHGRFWQTEDRQWTEDRKLKNDPACGVVVWWQAWLYRRLSAQPNSPIWGRPCLPFW